MDQNKLRKEKLKACVIELADELMKENSLEGTLADSFKKCFINTVDTTVECINNNEIFIVTGDIEAMWLRDSSSQVVQYMKYLKRMPALADMIKSLIQKQFQCIEIDPYANAFNIEANGRSWTVDEPKQSDWVWERKYEIDSLCYLIKLLYEYWKETGDTEVFNTKIRQGLWNILKLWRKEQKHTTDSEYYFIRKNCPPGDTLSNNGKGEPVSYTGMIWSGFRPSDDACKYGYLIPSNMFATVVLGYVNKIAVSVYEDDELAKEAELLKQNIEHGIQQYGIVSDETFGTIYAYETDGRGNYVKMDDANVPSLLSLPWLGYCDKRDKIYKNTRNFVLSSKNPYYYEGNAARGIGSPHTPNHYIWPIALCMQGLTSDDKEEQKQILETLLMTDAGTGYMHEGFHCDNPKEFTRDWFAWANSLFSLFVQNCFF